MTVASTDAHPPECPWADTAAMLTIPGRWTCGSCGYVWRIEEPPDGVGAGARTASA